MPLACGVVFFLGPERVVGWVFGALSDLVRRGGRQRGAHLSLQLKLPGLLVVAHALGAQLVRATQNFYRLVGFNPVGLGVEGQRLAAKFFCWRGGQGGCGCAGRTLQHHVEIGRAHV